VFSFIPAAAKEENTSINHIYPVSRAMFTAEASTDPVTNNHDQTHYKQLKDTALYYPLFRPVGPTLFRIYN